MAGDAWTLIEDGVRWQQDLKDGTEVRLEARNLRRTSSGIHAYVSIFSGPHRLAHDTLNIGRHPDRVRLANACKGKNLTADVVRILLDDFCAEVWSRWSKQYEPTEIVPDLSEMKPVEYLLKPYVTEGGGTILFAPPGQGKSYLALLMAQSINQGSSTYWRSQKRRVLYVNLERSSESVARRLTLVNQCLELPPDASMRIVNARGRTVNDIAETLKEQEPVLVLDSLSRTGMGSMIDDEVANRAMDLVNRIGHSWIVIAHTPRSDSTHVFGSQMYDAAADLTLQLIAQERNGELGIGLQGRKANDVPIPKMAVWAMRFDEYGLAGFRSADLSEFPGISAGEKMDTEDVIEAYLLRVGEAGSEEIATAAGLVNSTVWRHLKAAKNVQSRRDGKKILYSISAGK